MTSYLILILAFVSNALYANVCSQFGCPTGAPGSNDVIKRSIYTLSNNQNSKFADWAAYVVSPLTIDGPSRSRSWRSDPEIAKQYTLETADYKDANALIRTDRGHQVPLASVSNTDDWRTTNYLSNITPQSSNINQGPWVRLETAVRDLARKGNTVYVVTGPLYESFFAMLPGADEPHIIPSGYFKIVATISHFGFIKASAYVMEQNSARADNYCTKEVTIDNIESRSGLNIFPMLTRSKEYVLESRLGGLSLSLGC